MHRISMLCCSNSFTLSRPYQPTSHQPVAPFRYPLTALPPLSVNWRSTCSRNYRKALSALQSAATQEIVKTSRSEIEFIEVGYITNVHGLQGEISVKPDTGFPELRFLKPGKRWIKQQFSGRERIQEVELVEGKEHPGKQSWILKFKGIDTVDQAKELVGSSLLVTEEDRPELEEGEFYTYDLVGMKVVLKETGELIGTVANVFNSGANDLLQVMLDPCMHLRLGGVKPKSPSGVSDPYVWVPFVEAIVPDVDMSKREMQITPPEGLLELNIRSDERSKKERRQLEWKERKRFQRRLIAAKKKLCELKQEHVFHGFRYGEKAQNKLLANQIVNVNSKLLRHALESLEVPLERWNENELIGALKTNLIRNTIKIPKEFLDPCAAEENLGSNFKFLEKGLSLTTEGRVCVVLVVNDIENQTTGSQSSVVESVISENPSVSLQLLLQDDQRFVRVEDRSLVPLVLVCPAHQVQSVKMLFSNNDHFGFDSEKVWILEEEKLPVVSNSLQEQSEYKILMKTPWEILQSPIGSGGVISLLSSNNILEKLSETQVEYFKICSTVGRYFGGNLLLGFVNFHEADTGIQILNPAEDVGKHFDLVFSVNFMRKLTRQIIQFHAILKPNLHVVKAQKEWIDITPSSPNSYEFRASIYNSVYACSPDKVCVMEITD